MNFLLCGKTLAARAIAPVCLAAFLGLLPLAAPSAAAVQKPDMQTLAEGGASIFGLTLATGPASTMIAGSAQLLHQEAAERQLYSGSLLAAATGGTDALPHILPPLSESIARENIPVPADLARKSLSVHSGPEAVLAALLDMPYRDDGAIDEHGRYTLFADPARRFDTPGLNCSGLALEASRFLLRKNITLETAKRDRLGDSGPDSPNGEDWDFGWDLLLNISDGFERRFLLPGGRTQEPETATGLSPRGYDLHAESTWQELPDRLRPGRLYLFSLNVEGRRQGYKLLHYHVGVIHVAADGKAWLYQTTGKGKKSNRRDIRSAKGRQSFQQAFANTGGNKRMMLVLEVDLPK